MKGRLRLIWQVAVTVAPLAVLAACASGDGDDPQPTVIVVGGGQSVVDSSAAQSGGGQSGVTVITVGSGNSGSTVSEQKPVFDRPSGITDLVLITGQSNALGSGTDFDPALDSPVERFYAWTDEGWQRASLRQVWDLGWNPRTHSAGDPHNNFGLHFGKQVVGKDSDRVVGIVLATAPGEGISHWDYGSYFYNQIGNKALAALNDLPQKSAFDAILWHQGETDWVLNGTSDPDLRGVAVSNNYYSDKLYALISNFRGENWFGFGKPFICGETAQAPVNRRLMSLNSDNDPWTECVTGAGLPTYDAPVAVHFTAAGLRSLGQSYGEAYLKLVD